jgi:calcineurin-like phosphoesterase family protein
MAVFFTSDTHYFHGNIIKYCNRPFASVEKMNDVLVDNWNQIVKPEDHVFHLGDVAFANMGKVMPLLNKLNGTITLIRGNHDPEVMASCPRWAWVANQHKYKLPTGEEVWLSHYPREDERYRHRSPVDDGLKVVCGHIHTLWAERPGHVNVGVDVRNFAPVSEQELIGLLARV